MFNNLRFTSIFQSFPLNIDLKNILKIYNLIIYYKGHDVTFKSILTKKKVFIS